jgi:hypothetical protein
MLKSCMQALYPQRAGSFRNNTLRVSAYTYP